MNALFIHDHKFKYDFNKKLLFSAGKLNNSSFDRYFEHFNTITIISRYESIDIENYNINSLNPINDDRINFIPFDNQSTIKNRFFKRKKYKNIIKKIIILYDAIIIRVPSEIGFLAAKVCQEEDIPYVCEVVACPIDAMKGVNNLKSKIYLPIIKKSMIECVYNSYGALYVTNFFLQKRYPTSSLSISASASNVELNSISLIPKVLEDKNSYTIALIGNLDSDHKGYPVLYKALAELDRRIAYTINVLLIGAGKKHRKDITYENITISYTGNLTKETIHDVLEHNVDLYIQPSNQEGLPRATIEAMSHALPCIVSNAGGLPELIDNKYIHDSENYELLSEMIHKLLTDSNEYNIQSTKNLSESSKYLASTLNPIRFDFYRNYFNYLMSMREQK